MKTKVANVFFLLINLLSAIVTFTIIDHFIHGLEDAWSVPPHYFINKIPAAFVLAIIGTLLAIKVKNVWLKSLIVGAFTAILIQTKYYLQGYPIHFVVLFAFLHFFMLYPLLVIMFKFYYQYRDDS